MIHHLLFLIPLETVRLVGSPLDVELDHEGVDKLLPYFSVIQQVKKFLDVRTLECQEPWPPLKAQNININF